MQLNTDSAPLPSKNSEVNAFKVPANVVSKNNFNRPDFKAVNVRLDLKTCQDLREELILPSAKASRVTCFESPRGVEGSQNFCLSSQIQRPSNSDSPVRSDENQKKIPYNRSGMLTDVNSSFMENISFLSDITDISFTSLLEEPSTFRKKDTEQPSFPEGRPFRTAEDCWVGDHSKSNVTASNSTPHVNLVKEMNHYNHRVLPQTTWFLNKNKPQSSIREFQERSNEYNSWHFTDGERGTDNLHSGQYECATINGHSQAGYDVAGQNGITLSHHLGYPHAYEYQYNWSYPNYQPRVTEENQHRFPSHPNFYEYFNPYSTACNINLNLTQPQMVNIVGPDHQKPFKNVTEAELESNAEGCDYSSTEGSNPPNDIAAKKFQSSQENNEKSDGTVEQQNKEKKKRHRLSYTKEQIAELEKQFKEDPYPTRTPLLSLSEKLKIPNKHLIYWFQNRRMKEKKIRTETESKN